VEPPMVSKFWKVQGAVDLGAARIVTARLIVPDGISEKEAWLRSGVLILEDDEKATSMLGLPSWH